MSGLFLKELSSEIAGLKAMSEKLLRGEHIIEAMSTEELEAYMDSQNGQTNLTKESVS